MLLASPLLAANIYVRSTDGSDSDNGSTWALAKATLAGAAAIDAAGDTIYVSQSHAESTASAQTFDWAGTAASPVRILCANDGAEPPTALATTATVSTTGSNGISFGTQNAYYYGIAFTAGNSTGTASLSIGSNSGAVWFDNCKLTLGGSKSSNRILVYQNTSNSGHWWKDVTIKFANASQAIEQRSSQLTWSGGSVDTSTASPTALFVRGDAHWRTELTGVDLSGLGSGKSLVTVTGDQQRWVTVRNCKLGSSVALTTGTWGGHHSGAIQLVNSDSGDTNYRYQRSCYQGDIYSESTVVRSGGATDGTTPISRKMVSSANAKYYAPLESQEFVFWNDTTGSVTVTFQTVTDNVTLTDAEAWVEVDYLGNGSFPISSRATDRSTDILASAANQTTSTETWTTTGLTTPVPQKLAVTFTTAEKGLISARVMLAKASTTVYVCPEILTTAGRSYMLPSGNYINEPSTSGGSSSYSRARVVNQ
jgi:hypothetical protein